jgi:hypothetical protein
VWVHASHGKSRDDYIREQAEGRGTDKEQDRAKPTTAKDKHVETERRHHQCHIFFDEEK